MPKPRNYRFEIAPYSYFFITNYDEESRKFMDGEISNPTYTYASRFSNSYISANLIKVLGDRKATRDLQFVSLALALQKDPKYLSHFRNFSAALYGAPEHKYLNIILAYLARHGSSAKATAYSEENAVFKALMSHGAALTDRAATPEAYTRFRKYFLDYIGGEFSPSRSLGEAMKKVFKRSKLEEKGWRLREDDDLLRARTINKHKVVAYGKNYIARNPNAYNDVAVHEVYGHALRESSKLKLSIADSEGWSVLLEQLNEGQFRLRRSYRYLAATLGWGLATGEPLDFRCTWEVIWRLMSLSRRYEHISEDVKSFAMSEVTRVFRGGRPDLPGAVFLKDTAYFKGNIDIWHALSQNYHTYEDFVDILEGRKKLL
jgi:hypothetical protein